MRATWRNVINFGGRPAMTIARILVVAGSDSGGGAGIQADIKTVTMLGGHAATALAAVTVQNTLGVSDVLAIPPAIVVAQMRAVIDDIGVDAVKIGMIGSAETAHAVAEVLEHLKSPSPSGEGLGVGEVSPRPSPAAPASSIPIVFDPVMVATTGAVLADAATIAAFERLLRIATLVTPNLPEAEALGGVAAIAAHGPAVLLKGGHGTGATVTDTLHYPDGRIETWDGPRIATPNTHGTGCTLASGIATGLAQGRDLTASVERAIRFVRAALRAAPGLGQGHGPMGHALGVAPFDALDHRCRD